ncbi:A disintegrin and metalloproteinase with thrombospondin motifs 20-like isoform X1 [Daktulosphaira vitifoliae]|uniref:A disintegrin and metalloproteinase with thrombospondin motifs 20-like isoform X1 n=1 Tax=Daktulosphaira vitifoliae TaxID=58002 RepID=UPI0021AAF850|nr:A disintegrin and metalloproteinase with thrombospondin motifs 20-like isoform X1 [Daktulosphaira vitifoliae]
MSSKTLIQPRVSKWPLIAAVVGALFVMSVVTLMAAMAWTAVGYGKSPVGGYLEIVSEFVTVNDTDLYGSPSEENTNDPFNLQSDETQAIEMVPEQMKKKLSFNDYHDSSKFDKEFVKPVKFIPKSLHSHDILYGGDKVDQEKLTKHHSGQFRNKTAFIWDPHPEYEFKAFGKTFHLILVHDSMFVSPGIKVTHMKLNESWREPPNVKVDGCFYSGNVSGELGSIVTVSLCDGMTGHIRTSSNNYFIEPAEIASDHLTPVLHVFYRARSTAFVPASNSLPSDRLEQQIHHFDQHCGLQDNEVTSESDTLVDDLLVSESSSFIPSTSEIPHTPKFRRKRSLSSEHIVELMVVADKKMSEYHGHELNNYILTLMSIVSKIYKDKSIGNPMHIAVVKLVILRDNLVESRNRLGGIAAADMLHRFCEWQAYHNDENDSSNNHHDTALLLTREHVCRNHNLKKCDNTLGLAQLGTMCKINSCAIVQDNGLSAAFTIAHELGHVLSMHHDDDAKCKEYGQLDSVQHVMSRMLGHNSHPWTWSACSRHFLTEFLDAGNGKCLQDDATNDYLENDRNQNEKYLPGENYTEDKQCELIYGPGSKICSYMPVCQRLWCTTGSDEKDGCRTQHMPWAEGTQCWNSRNWCQQGKCVTKDRNALKPVNGGWGPWQPYGECTRTCGGGVKKSYRDCNNPPPSNGGKYCIGKRVQIGSCNTKDCPPDTPDFRGEQCAKFNNNSFNIPELKTDIQWLPKYGGDGDERCKLYCRVSSSATYYQLKDKVVDGTPCSPDSYDICVNGRCEKAGCDHVLGSTSQLDLCGICGGNNSSCKQISGFHNISKQGYSEVLQVPAGSSNLDIRQHGYHGSSKDDNYLALVDSTTGEYILNGNYVLSMFSKIIVYGGTFIEYSGSDAPVERINSSKPLNKDITVEVLSMGKLYAPDIVYQYTVMREERDLYTWALTNEWGPCDQICNGEQLRVYVCIRKATGEEAQGYCSDRDVPRPHKQSCNTHCLLKWKIIGQSECSVECGLGTRTQSSVCIQEIHKRSSTQMPDTMCSHLIQPSSSIPCTGLCLETHWKYKEWSTCSKSCGTGVQYREAFCVNNNGDLKEEISCNADEKIISRSCNTEKCPEWSMGDWSSCSATCGEGLKERSVWCTDNTKVLPPAYCDTNTQPVQKEPCKTTICPAWLIGQWSPCSVTCGKGIVRRIVKCNVPEDTAFAFIPKPAEEEECMLYLCPVATTTSVYDERHENEIFENPEEHESNSIQISSKLYTWKAEHWSNFQCSSSCGQGYRRRPVNCVNTVTGKSVSELLCKTKNRPKHTQVCIAPMCVTWYAGAWKGCSTECGQGFEERDVTCVSSVSGQLVDETHCAVQMEKPESRRSCESHKRCKPVAKWKIEKWGDCSAFCGKGIQERNVVCQSIRGNDEDEELCPEPKPETFTPCNNRPCESKQISINSWNYGEWSKCNVTCGNGYQNRQVKCQNNEGVLLPANQCNGLKKPEITQSCRTSVICPKSSVISVSGVQYKWWASRWSPCSATCGQGMQNRQVSCRYLHRDGWKYASSEILCEGSGKQPATQKLCNLRACLTPTEYTWKPDHWRECSHVCGKKGRQTRRVYCVNKAMKKVRRKNCDWSIRPPRKQKCNQKKCTGYTSCADVLRKFPHSIDKEYILTILGRNISIYCHSMSTRVPTEYITLLKDSENYSEMYDKRLKDPTTCPFNGERQDICPCQDMPYISSGLTKFYKIRFNVTSLTIESRDFTFAKQIHGRFVPYGEAGDCYSKFKSGCPQGKFSIDLNGTGMKISQNVMWIKRGLDTSSRVNKNEDNTKITGRCGGYCGSCAPDQSLKLDVVTSN